MSNDPFAFDEDDDRTVLRPGSGSSSPTEPPKPVRQLKDLPALGGINPLERAASPLLALFISMRESLTHPNPEQLRNRIIGELNAFRKAAQSVLGDPRQVTQASYVLCTVLDEAAMNTPWGHQSNWAQHNLLSTFHDEVIGGERFFTLLKRLGKEPEENIDVLELMYVCLSLGYEGNYRIAANGQNTLVKVRVWLYEIIASVRGPKARALSTQWQGSDVKESKLPRLTVLWVFGAAMLALSSLVYLGYRFSLGADTEQAISGFYGIQADPLQVRSIAPPAAPVVSLTDDSPIISLETLLQSQIDQGQILVNDSFNEGRIRILSDKVFASGGSTLNPDLQPLVNQIANALEQFQGAAVVVEGHSDNIPIRSGRFASNLALSQARAESVAAQMAASMSEPERVSAQGKGSLEPIADNASASGRARNRRVEVSVYY